MMRFDSKTISLAIRAFALWAVSTAVAEDAPETIVDKLAYLEAPLFVNDQLHWVEYISN